MKFASRLKTIVLALATIGCALMTGCLENLDITPPLVTILNPAPGEVVTGAVPIVVTASDDEDIEEITIFVDGEAVETGSGNSIIFSWNTATVTQNENHNISAFATDQNGNVGPSAITTVLVSANGAPDQVAPLVQIINPLANGTVRRGANGGFVEIVADVIDNSAIEQVEFFINGTSLGTDTGAPYSFDWDIRALTDGTTHTVYAKATDIFGNSGAQLITVTIGP